MVTDVIKIDNQAKGVRQAIGITEMAAEFGGLSHKEGIRLRLLTEELIGMTRGIAGQIMSDFWIEQNDKSYTLHLKFEIRMTREIREQLLGVSSSGKNSAQLGFMGKLLEGIATMMLPYDDAYSDAISGNLGFMTMGDIDTHQQSVNAYRWSLQNYKESLGEGDETDAAWDELEKSIVASIADDVKVSVKGSNVEIVICKNFK
ncbi:MAG: hypothetical protein K6E28_06835 [Eubacterium sp.]|nr:hypothetical protein [Eubacterium sp.]